ncbi:inorganic phosphate transporter [Roseibaca sp. Y0-43]|uniref:inorganic phosphate transporter n=1 Tax=Roseibaca sp. Y0-43 TaxID=2816854 RepID=UPI001D0C474A|nr:inorganic phosphate transporter [Roseibaca sp. Y0-43]
MSEQFEKSWKTLNKDLDRISALEQAMAYTARPLVASGVALAFMAMTGIIAAALIGFDPLGLIVVAAAIIGAYMALNIGANDVANNMGPAVGARALTIGTALIIAAICETAGALIAGGDVVGTVSRGIIAPSAVAETQTFIWAMLAALLAGALWVNLATWIGAPVSTTHSIVGGVMGAGVAAAGFSAVNWATMGKIAASWVISPLLGGLFAAAFLAVIKSRIIYRPNMIEAARFWVPILIGIMAGCFTTYLALKGFSKIYKVGFDTALLAGLVIGVVMTVLMRPVIRRQSEGMENRKKSLKILFNIPLIFSAALLSFAHGANDVANAIGPVAAIVHAVQIGGSSDSVGIPFWVMLIGAVGLSMGLLLFGPKLINIVGSEITRLNAMRAYCVSLAAAITVIFASWLGLPVSSTHIAIGAIFGVGFFREWYHERILKKNRLDTTSPPELRTRKKVVRRGHFTTILAAWVVTVPSAAILSAFLFQAMRLITL